GTTGTTGRTGTTGITGATSDRAVVGSRRWVAASDSAAHAVLQHRLPVLLPPEPHLEGADDGRSDRRGDESRRRERARRSRDDRRVARGRAARASAREVSPPAG